MLSQLACYSYSDLLFTSKYFCIFLWGGSDCGGGGGIVSCKGNTLFRAR